MSNPDIQFFASSGTWVKPERAVAVDVMAMGGRGGWSLGADGRVTGGEDGKLTAKRYLAGDLPAELEVTIGNGGRPGGRDGYALIVTHLASPGLPPPPPHDLMLHAHSHDDPVGGQPHEHLHTGPGHTGLEHAHPHRHAPGSGQP